MSNSHANTALSALFVAMTVGCGGGAASPNTAPLVPPAGTSGATGEGTGGTGGSGSNGNSKSTGGAGRPSLPGGPSSCEVSPPAGGVPDYVPGVWTDITPPGVSDTYAGVIGLTIDPSHPSTLYACVQDNGLWRTIDGGKNWARLGTPHKYDYSNKTDYIDVPFEVAVDPCDSKHLYATDGVRGDFQGFWVSHDGGENWVHPQGWVDIAKQTTMDNTDMAVDPSDFRHVLLSSHSQWGSKPNAGILETRDGGETWLAHQPEPSWAVGTPGIEFLFDPKAKVGNSETWLLMGSGFWRTTNAGDSWTKVSAAGAPHGLDTVFRAPNGILYAGADYQPVRSSDNGVTWQEIKTLPSKYYYAFQSDGVNLYTLPKLGWPTETMSYWTSPVSDGMNWTPYQPDKVFRDGPIVMRFDPVNHIVYSANWVSGLFAMKSP